VLPDKSNKLQIVSRPLPWSLEIAEKRERTLRKSGLKVKPKTKLLLTLSALFALKT
jgi:hypothetical protein